MALQPALEYLGIVARISSEDEDLIEHHLIGLSDIGYTMYTP